ncbi:putative heme-binding domain-containing protein [Cyclobacterium xiamenense]|uniref:Putative heme-binding domain-containing protein n=1 Tax=Cyclobacterium xiamenense TaxID=1297121 RepID=A0A1H6UW63_9BACT|nr:HEAT repeat domain-containing protein [Cyclobacterium xiamenense]SEI92212.1 putative heme-binding domain-containing protein [Cyclobacterium xiamenense]
MNPTIPKGTGIKMRLPLFSLLGLVVAFSCNPSPEALKIKRIDSETATEMAKMLENQVQPELEEGLEIRLWASDSLVFDPISIDFDDDGALYYSRTNRQKNSEFDIRGHQDWEIRSIGLQSIDDKRAFLREELSAENSDKNQFLADVNQDGVRDWRDMTVEKEHIYRLADTDGDGLADQYQLVFEGLNEEVTDVAGAVMKYGDDLFVGAGPDMWRMREDNRTGLVEEKMSISHGYGVHIGFGGHGMSGAEMGPDGRVYWGIGDIGFQGTDQEGNTYNYPNRGVIARSNPDGTGFEIFAMGVRNTHEFVFDAYGNLISVDNDGDHRGESERLVYLVDGSDTGWRINWQFGKYRDPKNNSYKVWMDEGMYLPRHEGQAAYFIPPITNYINGPTGMLYNPGTALGEDYKNTFFVAEFVGNPARSGIHAFTLEPRGAGFSLKETKKIMGGILATGMDFGPDGALYFSDWIDGWGTKDNGRVWKLDDVSGKNSPIRKETESLMKADFGAKELSELGTLLEHADQRIRQKAQFELVKRGKQGFDVFEKQLRQTSVQLARIHSIWGIAQMERAGDSVMGGPLLMTYLTDEDPEIRAQAARWLGDIRHEKAGEALIPLLKDPYARARFFSAEALGRIAHEPALQPIVAMLEENQDTDLYLRHAGSLALARIGKAAEVAALHTHASAAVRLAAVIALRRMQDPSIQVFLQDSSEYIVAEAARAINDDFSIREALPALGDLTRKSGLQSEPLLRRAINANLRVGTDAALANLLAYVSNETAPVSMRQEAMEALSTWAAPSVLDRVDGRYRGVVVRDPFALRSRADAILGPLLDHPKAELRLSAVQACGKIGLAETSDRLFLRLTSDSNAAVREAALRALAGIQWEGMDRALERATRDPEKNVRIAGLDLMNTMDFPGDLLADLLKEVIEKQEIEEKQAALLALTKVEASHAAPVIQSLLDQWEAGKLHPGLVLELGESIELLDNEFLETRFASLQTALATDDLLATYAGSLHGGDENSGRRIFFQHQTGQCIRCHAYDDYGGTAGPRLNGIGAVLNREQLLEALIDPGKRVAPGYGMVTLKLADGETVTGILVEENEDSVFLKIGNDPEKTVAKKQIKERTNAQSSMPDMKGLLSKREMRDLVSFLVTLTEEW